MHNRQLIKTANVDGVVFRCNHMCNVAHTHHSSVITLFQGQSSVRICFVVTMYVSLLDLFSDAADIILVFHKSRENQIFPR